MEQIEHRVIKLELRVDDHSNELKELQNTSKDLRASLQGIEKTLAQIKWLVTGGAVVFLANEIGLIKAVKMLVG